jgi:hypothetical protein
MRRLSASLLFLLAGTLTYAQTSSVVGCPVGFTASRQAAPQMMSASDASQLGPALGLHLMLNPLTESSIESIEVTVYGTSTKGRVLPVDTQSSDAVTKTFELHRTQGTASLNDGDVWMHQVGSLGWVDLISVTYADGKTWHATASLRCRAVPSNFLLVSRR